MFLENHFDCDVLEKDQQPAVNIKRLRTQKGNSLQESKLILETPGFLDRCKLSNTLVEVLQ